MTATDLEKGKEGQGAKTGTGAKNGNKDHNKVEVGKDKAYRRNFLDPFGRYPPPPPPSTPQEIPLAKASFVSKMGYFWIQPLLTTGYKRTLTAEDLWDMDPSRRSGLLGEQFLENFERRRKEVEEWNKKLDDGSWKPGILRRGWWWVWSLTGLGNKDGRRKVGMAMALSDTFFWDFWIAAVYKTTGDLAQVVSPLLTRQIIFFVQQAHYASQGVEGYSPPNVGKGVGFAIGLLLLLLLFSVCQAQTLSASGQCGILARGALISACYRRAMVLSGKSRVTITNSKLVNHISTDVSRIDFASSFVHFSWCGVLQLLEVFIILLVYLGVSSLTGIALLLIYLPVQFAVLKTMYKVRTKSMVFTDARIKLISELLMGIRVIKFFSWENPYLARVHQYRKKELVGIRVLLVIRTATMALGLSMPILASIITLVVYSFTGHSQNPAQIWTMIALLNLLRMPLIMLPTSLSTIIDAHNALNRLMHVFTASTLEETFLVDLAAPLAIDVDDASFAWEASAPPTSGKSEKKAKSHSSKKEEPGAVEGPPSELWDIDLKIPKGELWILCGQVGSGKSSLLQGLIGEMRKTKGSISFGGTVSYCAQTAWIQNASVRENIVFGRPFDEERYWRCVKDACLLPDFDMLPDGDQTQIGERGISLSGGQRQRVSLCRTLYYDADICLLDDVLSALDAHVGRTVMEQCILRSMKEKTRLLATHALHFMPLADRIVCIDNGRITESGTYNELLLAKGTFARLAAEYGRSEGETQGEASKSTEATQDDKITGESADGSTPASLDETLDEEKTQNGDGEEQSPSQKQPPKQLMQAEELVTGSISGKVYAKFFRAANGWTTVPTILFALIIMQGAQVVSQFELVWWQTNRWNHGQNFYLGVYAALGITTTLFTFLAGTATVIAGTIASRALHQEAIVSVLSAPMSMFDTTPIGRILNRFTKDIDSLDNRFNDSSRMALLTFVQIIGAFILVAIVEPYFIIAVLGVAVVYVLLWVYYKQSAREIKRIDNVLRSSLYAHFSESLAGLATIRAFGEQDRFIKDNERFIDGENKAYLLTVINQRWLGVRLDLMGALLSFIVALISVGKRDTISPSHIGLVLSAILSIQQSWSTGLRQYAEVENNLSSVERLQYYADNLPAEAPPVIEGSRPEKDWPQRGEITFEDVEMSYRPDLPKVLKGVSFTIQPGEKVGIVGRTGAGKSTITLCLFRIVELASGAIKIDGVDISKLGLKDLRPTIAIIPQDALLFNGTLRSNLDPFGDYDDAVLWSALQRAGLTADGTETPDKDKRARFTLDSKVEDEGLNMSVGERSLVSLARALVKDSRIVVLDEATASVDMENDSRIQRTIASEFRDKTLLCIAHRINTIAGYDRILVMDAGRVVAFDTPENLFSLGEGIFYSLCLQSGLGLADIQSSHAAMRS
ncbi:ABC transporter [Meredithblackwellia eburnea MCA 4105]